MDGGQSQGQKLPRLVVSATFSTLSFIVHPRCGNHLQLADTDMVIPTTEEMVNKTIHNYCFPIDDNRSCKTVSGDSVQSRHTVTVIERGTG
jgi:hypothetical protein